MMNRGRIPASCMICDFCRFCLLFTNLKCINIASQGLEYSPVHIKAIKLFCFVALSALAD